MFAPTYNLVLVVVGWIYEWALIDFEDGWTPSLPVPFFVLVLVAVLAALLWSKLSLDFYLYEIHKDAFKKEHGVIWKRYVTIPYNRVQNIDIRRGPIARMLGLSDLHIQTAGASNPNSPLAEGLLPGITREEAEKIREEIAQKVRESKEQGL